MNRFGLTRYIKEPIKRQIRQRSGFGCIFCGLWLYQYEHFDPEFKDAKRHDPNGICLLCGNEQDRTTKGRLTKKQIAEQYKHPIALSRGYANDYLAVGHPYFVAMGRIFFTSTGNLLSIDSVNVLSIEQPTKTEPLKLNAKFYDDEGALVLEIRNNEMLGFTTNWDIEQKGTRTIFRKKGGEIVLQINLMPPDVLEIERINMQFGQAKIYTDAINGRIYVRSKNGATIDLFKGQIITEGMTITDTGISFNKGIFIGVQEGLEFNKMDYRAYIDSGKIHSSND